MPNVGVIQFKFYLQAEKVYNQDLYFKKTVKYVGEPMTHLEAIASSAVLCFDNFTIDFFSNYGWVESLIFLILIFT